MLPCVAEAPTATGRLRVTVSWTAKEGMDQVGGLQVPELGVAPRGVMPGAVVSTSLTSMAEATEGPLLVRETV